MTQPLETNSKTERVLYHKHDTITLAGRSKNAAGSAAC